ncbi:PAS domain-containing protein [Heliobacillus mobilis]|uniref:PAS domain-containing protein n=1 Tax=Heliobacterium mobile TaxID=28064 RepID=A0A6I3SP40_HELMO|nr:PAS domain-containing protein [Heliobacterium mobile]MTV50823.1 PAS domain-containing protein [Heliobacterium mobile]
MQEVSKVDLPEKDTPGHEVSSEEILSKAAPCFQGLPVAMTVCDQDGRIVWMNDKSIQMFAKRGGRELIGKSLFDCHGERSGKILRDLLVGQKANCYTIEKAGIKKMIYQAPWYDGDRFGGLVEIVFEVPFDMPHFQR